MGPAAACWAAMEGGGAGVAVAQRRQQQAEGAGGSCYTGSKGPAAAVGRPRREAAAGFRSRKGGCTRRRDDLHYRGWARSHGGGGGVSGNKLPGCSVRQFRQKNSCKQHKWKSVSPCTASSASVRTSIHHPTAGGKR
jgi:hypothetical protein